MKKYKAGLVDVAGECNYYTDDFKSFFYMDDEEVTKDDIEKWAICLNSPWSQTNEKYTISCNCKDGYTPMSDEDRVWKCEYSVIGAECICATVLGYGNTEVEALNECINHFKELQKLYNADNIYF